MNLTRHLDHPRLPLSYAQKALWFIQQTNRQNTAYNMSVVLEGDGPIDDRALEKAFLALLDEQSLLKSVYRVDEAGAPFRCLLRYPAEALSFSIVESSVSRDDAYRAIRDDSLSAFDLENPPVVRVRLYKHGSQHTIHFCVHHINFDGGSRSLLAERLQSHYLSEVSSRPISRQKKSLDFSKYVEQEEEFISSQEGRNQFEFWRRVLEKPLPTLELPREFPRPLTPSHRGQTHRASFNPSTTAAVIKAAQSFGTTPYNLFLSAYRLAIFFHSGQSDLVLGTAFGTAGKTFAETIGYFVNKLPVRLTVNDHLTLREFIKETSAQVRNCFDNVHFPFPLLVERLRIERDSSRTPVFQANFTFLKIDTRSPDGEPSLWSFGTVDQQEGQFEIALRVVQLGDRFQMSFQYDVAITSGEIVCSIAESFTNIVDSMLQNSNIKICNLVPAPAADIPLLMKAFNETNSSYARDVGVSVLFDECVAAWPDRPALRYGNQSFTYATLSQKVSQLASLLVGSGLQKGDIVALIVDPSAETMITMLATLKAGGAFLPIDCALPKNRIDYILNDSGARFLLRKTARDDRFEFVGKIFDLGDSARLNVSPATISFTKSEAADPAYVIYTSGTTGNPKGVLIEHRCLVNYVSWFQKTYSINQDSIAALLTSYAFDLGYTTLWTTILSGGELHILPESVYKDVPALLGYFRDYKVNFIKLTPSLFNAIVNTTEFRQGARLDLKIIVTGGERAKADDFRTLFKKYPECLLVNHYGPTETTIGVMTYPIRKEGVEDFAHHPVIGRPNGNVTAYITNEHFQLQPIGVPGELLIAGDCVGRGYVGRADLTKEKFIVNPFDSSSRAYRSGDLARWRRNGTIEFLGRIDRQIKIRGYRVEPGEIEQQIQKTFGMKKVAVVEKNVAGAQSICAYYVFSESIDSQQMKEALQKDMPEYMVPSYFIRVEDIPTTANGKLDMNFLPNPSVSFSAPKTETSADPVELKLGEIWAGMLNRPRDTIGPTDNFFDLGGHSILAIRLLSEIKSIFGVSIPIATMYGGATISEIRKAISAPAAAGDGFVTIKAVGKKVPLVFIHPIGGHVTCYKPLADALDGHPFYGLQASTDGNRPLSIEAMATKYIEILSRRLSVDKVVLGGWSMGGIIALEMAQQLKSEGKAAQSLVLVDTFAPAVLKTKYSDSRVSFWFQKDLEAFCGIKMPVELDTGNLSIEQLETRLFQLLPTLKHDMSETEKAYLREIFSHYKVGRLAINTYHPTPFSGQVVLLQAGDSSESGAGHSPSNGWGSLLPKLLVRTVPGNHHTVVQPSSVQVLATEIEKILSSKEADL